MAETVLTKVMDMGTITGMATRGDTATETETETAASTKMEMGRNTAESFARGNSPRRSSARANWNEPN
jgi:hypothetical protein